jgi:hypothetical protein
MEVLLMMIGLPMLVFLCIAMVCFTSLIRNQ